MATRAYVEAHLLNTGLFVISSGLTITCVFLLTRDKAAVHQSQLLRRCLLGYVTVMGVLSLTAIFRDSVNFVEFFHYLTLFYIYGKETGPVHHFQSDILSPVLPLAMWFAEAFMIWRLYVHIKPNRGSVAFLLGCMTMFLGTISIASGTPILDPEDTDDHDESLFNYRFFAFSAAAVNTAIFGMVAAQLIIWNRVLDGIEDTWMSFSTAVARILIASGAPLTLVSIVAGSSFNLWVHDCMIVPMLVMPQICAISTLLIVCCILQGADSPIRLPDSPLREGTEFGHTEGA